MKIVGIDLGLTNTGICIISNRSPMYEHGISTGFGVTDKKCTKEKKLIRYVQRYLKHVEKNIEGASLVTIEKPFNIMGHGKMLLELYGIVKCLIIQRQIPYVQVSQMTLKKFAIRGNAQKSEMVMQAFKEFKFEAPSEDEIDAFWLAKIGDCLSSPESYSKSRVDVVKKLEIINYD